MLDQHIILIGFKNVGKSIIGKKLAKQLNEPFIDLDREMEKNYLTDFQKKLNCRQIMEKEGEDFFRELESNTLAAILQRVPAIISLGGGTPLAEKNQTLIAPYRIIHVVAPRGIVFERIMVNGRPAFFLSNDDPFDSFNRIWDEREAIYKKLTSFSINNNGSVETAIDDILKKLKLDEQTI